MNNYILCYKTPEGNRPCKTLIGEYIIGVDKEDVDYKSTWDWQYLIKTYGEKNLIIIKKYKFKINITR